MQDNNTKYPQVGDHIFVARSVFGIKLYEHHGIYVGDAKVVHYNGLARGITFERACFEELLSNIIPLDKRMVAKIELTDLAEFALGDSWEVRRHAGALRTGEEAANYAKSRIGEQKYNLLINNCEHFCSECIMGEHVSDQVSEVRRRSQVFSDIEPVIAQTVAEIFDAKSKDEIYQSGLNSLVKLGELAKQNALLRIKNQKDQANAKINEILDQGGEISDKIVELKNTLKLKIARDFGIKI